MCVAEQTSVQKTHSVVCIREGGAIATQPDTNQIDQLITTFDGIHAFFMPITLFYISKRFSGQALMALTLYFIR
jgi:protein tyrosine phosphatase (PTP) superfamily phosphohydrolase (DUF442 family)